jgi:hypothetical protein
MECITCGKYFSIKEEDVILSETNFLILKCECGARRSYMTGSHKITLSSVKEVDAQMYDICTEDKEPDITITHREYTVYLKQRQ